LNIAALFAVLALIKEAVIGIHTTAIIEKGASIHESASVGAYSVIGAEVTLAEGVCIESHVAISGNTSIGRNTHIYPFASLGHPPQDLKFKGEKSRLVIGENNTIREHVTMNPGTEGGGMITSIGNNCLFMVGAHVAHDCRIGNNVILANNATLAGHVVVDDYAIIGGLSAIHQFVRIGAHAMIGGMSGIESDVIPYGNAFGERAGLMGLNLTGLKRRGFDKETINRIRQAFKELFVESEENFATRLLGVEERFGNINEVTQIINFIRAESSRGLCHPKSNSTT